MRVKGFIGLVFFLLLCIPLSGCVGSVEEYLEAPATGADQSAIIQVLTEASGSGTIKLKYPRSGSYLSPFLFVDLNQDGTDEAIAFYADESLSRNVRVALLINRPDIGWQIVSDTESIGTDIDRVELGSFYEEKLVSLVVGYTSVNMSDKYMEVYNCRADGLAQLYEQSYSQFVIADFTDSGTDDLAVVGPQSQSGRLGLSLMTVQSGKIATVSTILLDARLKSCTGLLAGSGIPASLYVDVQLADSSWATDVIRYDESGRLTSCSLKIGADIISLTSRPQQLNSRDADGDGYLESPVVLGSAQDGNGQERWLWVSYYDFADLEQFEEEPLGQTQILPFALDLSADSTPQSDSDWNGQAGEEEDDSSNQSSSSHPQAGQEEEKPQGERIFGLIDLKYDCFVPLPERWKGAVQLREMLDGNWCLVWSDEPDMRLFIFQAVESGGQLSANSELYGRSEGYLRIGSSGGMGLYVYATPQSGVDTYTLRANACILS